MHYCNHSIERGRTCLDKDNNRTPAGLAGVLLQGFFYISSCPGIKRYMIGDKGEILREKSVKEGFYG